MYIFSFWPLLSIFTAENSPKLKKPYFIEKLRGHSCPFKQIEYMFKTKSEFPVLLCECRCLELPLSFSLTEFLL